MFGPLLSLWKKQSRARLPRQLYVVLHRRRMDVACYAQGNLLFVNSFEYEHTDDICIIYYMYGNRSEWINRKTSCVFSAMCPCEMI